jgi:hypothetical protein
MLIRILYEQLLTRLRSKVGEEDVLLISCTFRDGSTVSMPANQILASYSGMVRLILHPSRRDQCFSLLQRRLYVYSDADSLK